MIKMPNWIFFLRERERERGGERERERDLKNYIFAITLFPNYLFTQYFVFIKWKVTNFLLEMASILGAILN